MKIETISWLAGLLEGEGSFAVYNGSPSIRVTMIDKDVIEKAANLFHTPVKSVQPKGQSHYQLAWYTYIHGAAATGWMLTLYSFLGERRREKIREVMKKWKSSPRRPNNAHQGVFPSAPCHPERPIRANGLCRSCYMKEWHKKYGRTKNTGRMNLFAHKRGITIMSRCHPDRASHAKGLCKICYQQKWRLAKLELTLA